MNTNPRFIDSANVDYFGFLATFNPFAKSLKFDISNLTTFKSGGQANIDSITFVVQDNNGNTYNGAIDPSNSETNCTITGLESGVLYFGVYTIIATLTEPATSDEDEQTYVIELNPNVCYDEKLNNANLAQGCLLIDVNCNNATMTIKEGANVAYAGKAIVSKSFQATVNYPIDPETQEPFLPAKAIAYLPYSLSLADSVTGTYSIVNITTVNYDLENNCVLAIQYRSNINNQDVTCGNGMCEITCCMIEAVDIIERGGAKGVQMKELYTEALVYYNLAKQLADCGKNNRKYVDKVKAILNCDCKCTSKSQLIQPAPITFDNKNIIGGCGTTTSIDDNGDILIKSFVYQIVEAEGEDKISFEQVQTDACTKTTYVTLHCDKIERCIFNILSTDVDILNEWKTLFGIGCACDGVTVTADIQEYYIYTDLEMASLETHYFSINEKVLASYFDLSASITGGTIKSVGLYSNLLNNGTTLLAPITTQPVIPTSICASEMISKMNHPAGEVYQILLNVNTECGCDVPFVFDEDIQRVLYSERYGYGYRFNPQIENPPIVVSNGMESDEYYTYYEVIFADSYFSSLGGSLGSSIRSMKIKVDSLGNYSLDETRILFGKKFTGTGSIATENNLWGDQICFDYASAINLDNNEIVNGYPVMYFCTFGGAICRAVRERDTQCNEMANWKVYRIGGEKNVLAGGTQLYGMKTWKIDENGNPTFLIVDNDLTQVKIFYMSTQGSRNDSANWSVQNLFVLGGANANIQVFGDRIYAMGLNQITCYPYIGTDVISELITTSNYTTGDHNLTSGGVVTPNVYTDGAGDLATVDQPLSMWKDGNKYYFSNARDGSNPRGSYIRYFEFNGEAPPTRPQDYTFYTEILPNSNSNLIGGTWVAGVSSTLSGETFGMVYIAGIGWISIYQYGFRIFNFTTKVCSVFSGQATSGGNLDSTQPIMDSQWTYNVS